jgi:ubiquinone/menaquinone biosynthesis C-methylase UbiE
MVFVASLLLSLVFFQRKAKGFSPLSVQQARERNALSRNRQLQWIPSGRRMQRKSEISATRINEEEVSSISANETKGSNEFGLAHWLLNRAIDSPLWQYILAPQAKAKMLSTAEANGVPWTKALEWIEKQDGPWNKDGNGGSKAIEVAAAGDYPAYYTQKFHAYETGNLSWQAAFEQEVVGRAVGARNFPAFKDEGDVAFRNSFQSALDSMNVCVPDNGIVVDMACGTGLSTRGLGHRWPNVKQIVGIDMSPYFVSVGQRLMEIAPSNYKDGGEWVNSVPRDDRIELRVGDASSTGLPDSFADAVNVQFLFHELPIEVSKKICREAHRILKPGGELWIGEMDFEAPPFAEQRSNALLFSLIRATEPFLDEYADGCPEIRAELVTLFETVRIEAATGRHFALMAKKAINPQDASSGKLIDNRFKADGSYAVEDTHLKVWEVKE